MKNGYVIGRRYRRGGFRPELDEGTIPVDADLVVGAFRDLENGTTHPAPCLCPSCCYAHYRKMPAAAGRPHDRLTFFLEWLENPVRLSFVKGAEEEVDAERPGVHRFARVNARDLLDVSDARIYREMEKLLRRYWPKVQISAGSIKVRLWRFKKSGLIVKIMGARYAEVPVDKKKFDATWTALRRAARKPQGLELSEDKKRRTGAWVDRMIARTIFEWQPRRIRERFYFSPGE